MKKSKVNLDKILKQANLGPSRWELDNIIWNDRASNPNTLKEFLKRISELKSLTKPTLEQKSELTILLELADGLDEADCMELLSNEDEVVKHNFIETIARHSALEVLTNNRVSYETMNTMCKLSPNDFILASKRTQDLINSIRELVIQGETLSSDVAGA
jgi:hypothetical protein